MRKFFLLPVVAGLLIGFPVLSQPVTAWQSGLIESLLESIESKRGELADYETLLHELENLQRNPLDLNSAGKEELQRLPFLTDFQISSLINYRQEHGNLLSIYELSVVHGYTDEIIRMMLPFVTVVEKKAESFSPDRSLKQARHEITLRTQHVFEKAAGYVQNDSGSGKSGYPGNPWLYYARYGFESSHHIKAGITMENDPGEDFFGGDNPHGFDFYSAYLMVNDAGPVRTFLAGDYRLQFGQGLTLWNGSAPGKSSLAMNIVKRQDGIRAFTSADENDLFRGVAATAASGRFVLTLFYSSRKRDANITDTMGTGVICFSSFQESGYHRTASEITDEKSVRETAYGGNLHFRNNWLKLGTTLVKYDLDKYHEKGSDPEDLYDFEGTGLLNWGFDYTATLHKVQLFGETSHGYHGWATLNGVLISMNKYASLSLLYRNFQPEYFSLHAAAFSEGSSNNNEEAFYAGTIIHPFPHWQISAYADLYRFPWLRYRVNAPSSGSDYLFQVDFVAGKKTNMFFRMHYEENPENEDAASLIMPRVISIKRTGLRYHVSWQLSSKFKFQNRIEAIWVKSDQTESDRGIMAYQDIECHPFSVPVSLAFRLAWFNTDSYDSRIYAYEQDLSSGFSFAPLYMSGYRTYFLIRYDIGRNLSCRLRVSQINYVGKESVSSGLDKLEGSTRSEVKLQLTARF
jgi:hypothetical protein